MCSEPGVHGVFLRTSVKERRKNSASERRERRIVAARGMGKKKGGARKQRDQSQSDIPARTMHEQVRVLCVSY